MNKIFSKMKKSYCLIFLLTALAFGNEVIAQKTQKDSLLQKIKSVSESGDILLISMPCRLCTVIENETNSLFSHLGIIIKDGEDYFVLESAGRVTRTKLANFVQKAKKFTFLRIIRSLQSDFLPSATAMNLLFKLEFDGLPYDPYFLYLNQIKGQPALYCSEFVKEYFDSLGINTPDYRPMTFGKNISDWENYYKPLGMEVPEGQLGINPESFNLSDHFKKIKSFYKSF